jgi:hypothetical protein
MKTLKSLAIAVALTVYVGFIFWVVRGVFNPAPEETLIGVGPEMGQELGEATSQLETWLDQAGFKFSYPEGVLIDPHQEDTESYAHLELITANTDGKMVIWVKETDYETASQWAEEELAEDIQIFETSLGGQEAIRAVFENPKKMVLASVDVDALVLVEIFPDEKDYWQTVSSQIINTFEFIPIEGEPEFADFQDDAGLVIEEPEEVIE